MKIVKAQLFLTEYNRSSVKEFPKRSKVEEFVFSQMREFTGTVRLPAFMLHMELLD